MVPNPIHANANMKLPDLLQPLQTKRQRPWQQPHADLTTGHLRKAAVLMPFYERDGEIYLIYIHRAKAVDAAGREKKHSRQIGFPGGKVDSGESTLQAAIREAWEEIDLNPGLVQVLGTLGSYQTYVSGFVTEAIPAYLSEPPLVVPNEDEVSEIYHIPVSELLALHQRDIDTRSFQGVLQLHYHWQHASMSAPICIWGMTGRITWEMLETLLEAGSIGMM